MGFTRAREVLKVTGRPQLTLADLPNPDVMRAFAAHLQKQWESIARHHDFDYTGLNMDKAKLLRAGADTKFWEATRAITPPSIYKKTKARYRQLKQQVNERAGPHPYDLLLPKQLKALLPLRCSGRARLESGPFFHSCNHLETRIRGAEQGDPLTSFDVLVLLAA